MINYQVVSVGAILRDYIDPKYINDEHKRLVDIADSLYNINIPVDKWNDNPEYNYKALYHKYDNGDFWTLVLKDMSAIDSQITEHNKQDLIDDYNYMVALNDNNNSFNIM